jgi:lysophospholipase L1-like esterase
MKYQKLIRSLIVVLIALTSLTSCKTNYTVINKGVGGNNTNDLLKRVDKDVLQLKPDLVIIMVGTNDMINSNKFISYSQYLSNYKAIINKLKENKIEVVLMSPPPVDTGYVFQRHKRILFKDLPNSKIDSVREILHQLAITHQIHYFDLNSLFKITDSPNRTANSLIINKMNKGIEDGIHPTKEGYKFITQHLVIFLKENKLLKKNKKIVCFGDSMTYGSFMVGEGTIEGETYPAFLNSVLNGKKNQFLNK